jgi:hypothetical protein
MHFLNGIIEEAPFAKLDSRKRRKLMGIEFFREIRGILAWILFFRTKSVFSRGYLSTDKRRGTLPV